MQGDGVTEKTFARVFHPSDFTRGSEAAFCHALKIALAAKGKLEIFHSADRSQITEWTDFPSVSDHLKNWQAIPQDGGYDAIADLGLHVKKLQAHGDDPLPHILKHFDHHQPDLVVVSTHQRRGLARWMHRAIAKPIAQASEGASLFVPRSTRGFVSADSGKVRLDSILIPVDSHPSPQRAVDVAVRLATLLGEHERLTFTVLHAGVAEDMPQINLPERDNWQVIEHCTNGKPEDVILDGIEEFDADVVVMSTMGEKGFLDALRGSTTERIVRSAPCPVLAVPVSK